MRNLVLPVKRHCRAQAQARQAKDSNRASRLRDDHSCHDPTISAGLSPLRRRAGPIACRCAVPASDPHRPDASVVSASVNQRQDRCASPPLRDRPKASPGAWFGSGFEHCVIFFAPLWERHSHIYRDESLPPQHARRFARCRAVRRSICRAYHEAPSGAAACADRAGDVEHSGNRQCAAPIVAAADNRNARRALARDAGQRGSLARLIEQATA